MPWKFSSGSGPIELRSGVAMPPAILSTGGRTFLPEAVFFPVVFRVSITVGGDLSAPGLVAGTVSVGGEMKIANITGTSISGVSANTITAVAS